MPTTLIIIIVLLLIFSVALGVQRQNKRRPK